MENLELEKQGKQVLKLNVLLAITDTLRIKYKNMVSDFTKFFSKAQGSFMGTRSTYVAREGAVDDPSKRAYQQVITTVEEKFKYFIKESGSFINALFSQEKTNSMGVATAELKVEGKSWGIFTSLELLRLKSLIEASDLGNLTGMLEGIPVRSDSQIWKATEAEEYSNRAVWETELMSGISRTTEKEQYILHDPNMAAGKVANYSPQVAVKTNTIEIGDYTNQHFSGQWSHRERAGVLKRRNDLLVAVVQALKECNDCEVVESNLTAEKIFGYILFE